MKKGQNEGTHRIRKDGIHEWRISIDGTQKSFYANTKLKAQEKAQEFILAKASGLDVSRNSSIKELAEKFLQIKENTVSPKTFESYESMLRLYILPSLKNVKLSDLTTDRCQTLINSLISKGVSSSNIIKMNGILVRLLNYSIKLNYISRNAAQYVELPKHQIKEMNPFSTEELSIFLENAKEDEHFALWHLLALTGMRVGESLALEWKDLNLETRELTISKSFDDKHGTGETKSRKTRRIVLSEETIEILKTHQAAQLEKLLNKPDYYQNNDLIFASSVGTQLHRKNIDKRNFKKITGAGDRTIHQLRHSFASLSLAAGIDVVTVSHYLGHANPNVTLSKYSHFMPKDSVNPATVLANLLEEKS